MKPIITCGFMLAFSLLFTITAYALDESSYSFFSIDQEKRFDALTKSIRCIVCQNQSIADSNAPLASDLRKKVHQMILENKTDKDIENYLVKRYGEFILFKPRINKLTIILWSFPYVALIIALFLIMKHYLRRPI